MDRSSGQDSLCDQVWRPWSSKRARPAAPRAADPSPGPVPNTPSSEVADPDAARRIALQMSDPVSKTKPPDQRAIGRQQPRVRLASVASRAGDHPASVGQAIEAWICHVHRKAHRCPFPYAVEHLQAPLGNAGDNPCGPVCAPCAHDVEIRSQGGEMAVGRDRVRDVEPSGRWLRNRDPGGRRNSIRRHRVLPPTGIAKQPRVILLPEAPRSPVHRRIYAASRWPGPRCDRR
jgi:hypothetical protein